MKVITGSAKGCRLRSVEGASTRPTTAFVKEAIFSIIQFDLPDRTVLDLFAGTGQMGIEALSRGARRAVFVDNSLPALAVIRDNLRHTKLIEKSEVLEKDAMRFISSTSEKFDLVFLDPPYQGGEMVRVLQHLVMFDILRDGGIIICETGEGFFAPDVEKPYFRSRSYRYGTKTVTIYTKSLDRP